MLKKLQKLSPAEGRLLLKALLLVAALRIGLWVLPFRTVRQLVDRLARPKPGVPLPAEGSKYRQRAVWAVHLVARRLLRERPCLTQALAVQVLFGRRGFPAELHIGVKKDPKGQLLAHAWVESEGHVVIGDASSPHIYTRLTAPEARNE